MVYEIVLPTYFYSESAWGIVYYGILVYTYMGVHYSNYSQRNVHKCKLNIKPAMCPNIVNPSETSDYQTA